MVSERQKKICSFTASLSDDKRTANGQIRRRKSPQKDVAKIIDMAVKDIPAVDISRALDIPEATVKDIIARFEPIFKKLPEVRHYRTVKADLLAAAQLQALESALTPQKLHRASFLSALQGFEILNKAERLESNLSTDNVSHKVFGRLSMDTLAKDE